MHKELKTIMNQFTETKKNNMENNENNGNKAKVAAAVIGAGAMGAGAAIAMQHDQTENSQSLSTANDSINDNEIAAVDTIPEVEVSGNASVSNDNPQPQVVRHTVEHHYHDTTNVNQVAVGSVNIEDNDNTVVNIQQQNDAVASAPVQEQAPQDEDVKVEVISIRHDVDVSGQKMDIALVDINEQPTLFVDADQDGTSDIFVADVNRNGNIEREEVMDITEHHIPMPTENDIVQNEHVSYHDDPTLHTCGNSDIPDYSSDSDITLVDL